MRLRAILTIVTLACFANCASGPPETPQTSQGQRVGVALKYGIERPVCRVTSEMRLKVYAKLCGQYSRAAPTDQLAVELSENTCRHVLLSRAESDAADAARLVNRYTRCGFADEGEWFLRAYISMASDMQSLINFAKMEFNYTAQFMNYYFDHKHSIDDKHCSKNDRKRVETSFKNDWYIENIDGRIEFVEDMFVDNFEIWIDDDGVVRQECP